MGFDGLEMEEREGGGGVELYMGVKGSVCVSFWFTSVSVYI